ncbi:transketolase [bacterium]|nr:transketolase [bacterium]
MQGLSESEINSLTQSSKKLRREILTMIHSAKSGHPGGSLSCIDILNVLYSKCMRVVVDKTDKNYDKRDRFILSKGHASAALYSVMAQAGFFDEKELMTFRQLGSRLQGHPCAHKLDGVEVSTGSLGQGLSMGVGMALGLRLDNNDAKVFVLMGDGEIEEGSVWEAVMNANAKKLDNLIAFVDRNKLQIDGSTEDIKEIGSAAEKFRAFGWNAFEINGHDFNEIYLTTEIAKQLKNHKPTVIIANTIKGKGVSFMENQAGWHGKAPNDEQLAQALTELGGQN